MILRAGLRIGEDLELLRDLGGGATGQVWIALHRKLGIEVAAKFFHDPRYAGGADGRRRFARDARACARIDAPGLVRIFDYGLLRDGTPFVVMEKLDGETLSSRLERGPLSLGAVVPVVVQLARALGKAHEHGVVYRTLGPEDVMLCPWEGSLLVKLVDLGMRTADDGPDAAHEDLVALGLLAYEALTGERTEALAASGQWSSARPTACGKPQPPLVEAWLARALAADPQKGFASASDLAREFVEACSASHDAGPALASDADWKSVARAPSEPPVALGGDPPEPPAAQPSEPPPAVASAEASAPSEQPVAVDEAASDAPRSRPPDGRRRRSARSAGNAWMGLLLMTLAIFVGGSLGAATESCREEAGLGVAPATPPAAPADPGEPGASLATAPPLVAPATEPAAPPDVAAPEPTSPDPSAVPAARTKAGAAEKRFVGRTDYGF
jgi:serine/threonine-protein kinase